MRLSLVVPLALALALPLGGCVPDAAQGLDLDDRGYFEQLILPSLTETCARCHGIQMGMLEPFLTPGSEYTTVKAYRGQLFLTNPPEWSLLLNRGQHAGPALTDGQYRYLYTWLEREARALDTRVLATPPVAIGPGEFLMSLKNLVEDPEARITFTAAPLSPAGLRLTDLKVIAGAGTGLKLKHPVLTLITQTGTYPDPADGLSQVDLTVSAGSEAPLGTGEVLLPRVPEVANLEIVFESISRTSEMAETKVECKALPVWDERVRPTLQAPCGGCHAGNNPLATKAFDMSDAGSGDTEKKARLCVDTLARVNLMDPAKSLLVLQPTPPGQGGLPNHPFKLQDPGPFRDGVVAWAMGEK